MDILWVILVLDVWGHKKYLPYHQAFPITLTNECPRYDPKHSDGEVPVMQDLWVMRNTPSLLSSTGSLWPRVIAPDRLLLWVK